MNDAVVLPAAPDASAPPFPHLASPVRLGPMVLRNRVVLLPHGAGFADSRARLPTRQHRDYYAARAAGGAGLVCTESMLVSGDSLLGWAVLVSNPETVPGYRRIADAVHAHGAKICGQLSHMGHQSVGTWARAPLIGPSALPDPMFREPSKPMDAGDRARVLADFVAGARNLKAAGFDAVELKAAHDGLLHQFLSPLTNDRDDDYGGTPEKRLRYVLEVAAAIRAEIGGEVALGIRLLFDECFPGGYGLEDGLVYARLIERAGLFDYITTDIGILTSIDRCSPSMGVPEGSAEYAYAAASAAVDLPIIAFGGIATPAYAEHVVASGKAAAVGMARQLIADPEWPNKAFAGAVERIRPCTRCNELCIGAVGIGQGVGCTINPWVGYREQRPEAPHGARRVVVVGGGPAGLEAARVLAGEGCAVTLFEQAHRLGGRLAVAGETGGRTGWLGYVAWLGREVARLGVDVRLGSRADADDIRAMAPDAVVIAAGSEPMPSTIAGDAVVDLDRFLAVPRLPARVALVDDGAANMALWSAAVEAKARAAEIVHLVTPAPMIGMGVDPATMATLYPTLQRGGIRFWRDRVAVAAEGGQLTLLNPHTGETEDIEIDLVMAHGRRKPAGGALAEAFRRVCTTVRIGDALVSRDSLAAAVREGQSIAVGLARGEAAMGLLQRDPGHSW